MRARLGFESNITNNVIEISYNAHFLFLSGMPAFRRVSTLFDILLFFSILFELIFIQIGLTNECRKTLTFDHRQLHKRGFFFFQFQN